MEILGGTLLVNTGATDRLYLKTDLPNPVWPFTGNLLLRAEVAAGRGVAYVEEHFGQLSIQVKDIKNVESTVGA